MQQNMLLYNHKAIQIKMKHLPTHALKSRLDQTIYYTHYRVKASNTAYDFSYLNRFCCLLN